ncbi:MAG: M20/M25/M40 family metallo-hydrolase, partial [Clostridia bacterium]|nr:M20/M25/M40 family metallo-hydrolase [Clostridia bacterium]
MSVLHSFAPQRVLYYFEELCKIPHGSGDTKKISDYCVSVANNLGLWVRQDQFNNVIIKKPASAGYEHHPAVIIQGHLDMVCEKDPDCDLDFAKDGLRLSTDGEWIFAKGTTLGGDDGIAVAMALAVLEDNSLAHPPIEAVFTTDEETGMYGAQGIDVS